MKSMAFFYTFPPAMQDAMLYLLRGHELELVLVVGRLLTSCRVGGPDVGAAGYVDCAVRYLCYRALRLSQGLVALNLAKTHSKVRWGGPILWLFDWVMIVFLSFANNSIQIPIS